MKNRIAAAVLILIFGGLATGCAYWCWQSLWLLIALDRSGGDAVLSGVAGSAFVGTLVGTGVFGFLAVACLTGVTERSTQPDSERASGER